MDCDGHFECALFVLFSVKKFKIECSLKLTKDQLLRLAASYDAKITRSEKRRREEVKEVLNFFFQLKMASLSLCSIPGFKHIATLFLLLGICIGRVILHAVLCVPPVCWLFLQPLLPGIRVLLRQAFVLLVHFCCLLWDVGLVVGGGFFLLARFASLIVGGGRSKGSVQRFLLFGQMCQ